MALSREALLRATALPSDLVTIPGETEKVKVRGLSNSEVIELGKAYNAKGMGDYPMLLWGVIDDEGLPLLKEDDLPAIMKSSAERWQPLLVAIRRLTFTTDPKA